MKKLIVVMILILAISAFAEPLRNITFDDLYGYKQIEEFDLSPDGKTIVFELTEYDLDGDSSFVNLWTVSTSGGSSVQLTNSGDDSQPRWSPDGRNIAFVSSRYDDAYGDSSIQIWLVPATEGEPACITDISTGASGAEWSQDSNKLLFRSKVYPDCPDDHCNRERLQEKKKSKIKAKLYDHLLFRHYNSWYDGRRNHTFIYDIPSGKITDLTPFDKDAPPIALAGKYDYCLSPDGSEACFVMNTDTVIAASTNNDIFTVSVRGRKLSRISTSKGNDTSPAYSPNSRYITFKSMARAGFESDQNNLMLFDRVQKTTVNLTEDFDRSVGEYVWGPYSKYIYFTAVDKSKIKIYRLSVQKHQIKTLIDDAVCRNIRISQNGNYLYYLKSTTIQPYEIYEYSMKTRKQKRLTFFTDGLFSTLKLTPAEDFWYIGAGADSVHGLMTLPPDFDPESRYPLVLLIHGGPQWCWLTDFNYYGWNTQLMAAQGYVVVQIDPHGSRGYGQDFVDAVTGDWGGKAYQDLMMGVDYLLKQYDYINSQRMAALGRSYGGFMVNWIAGHTEDFACLVSVAGVFDHVSDYYSTEELWFPNWEFGGTPWDNKENYLKYSPSEYVKNFTTPTLVVHGQLDYRVDVSQAVMMFTALQSMDVPSQLLYFPDEGHSVWKLHNIRYLYEVQLEWLARWLK